MLHAVLVFCALQGDIDRAQPLSVEPPLATTTGLDAQKRLLPFAASVVPGFLVHGSGHYVANKKQTAWSLLKWEGLGLAGMAAGIAGLGLSGAARQTVGMFALVTMAGAGLFITSWLADVYGVLAPPGGWGDPIRVEPWLQARMGARYIHDPTFDGKLFIGPALDLRWRRWRWSPSTWFALDSQNLRLESLVAYRAYGPLPHTTSAPDGSYVDVVAGTFHHRHRHNTGLNFDSNFTITSFDARLEARLDLIRLTPALAGAFVDGNAGVGLAAYHFPVSSATEANAVLLGGFGFGAYLGRRADRWGQARVYYNHRHDDFAGGLKTYGLGSGALGHFGADLMAYVSQRWGFRIDVQAGSAWIAGVSALYRYGKVSL